MEVHVKKNKIKKNGTITCDNCGKLMQIEQAYLLPKKILCMKCLVGFYFSEWCSRINKWKNTNLKFRT